MTTQRKRKGWLDYKVPMWLKGIAATYLIFFALVFMYELGKGTAPNVIYDILFVLGFLVIVITYFLWVYKQKRKESRVAIQSQKH